MLHILFMCTNVDTYCSPQSTEAFSPAPFAKDLSAVSCKDDSLAGKYAQHDGPGRIAALTHFRHQDIVKWHTTLHIGNYCL